MRFTVDPSPSGGYHVRIVGSPAPLSHHDTEEEAQARLAAYRRGAAETGGDLVDLPDGSEVLVRQAEHAIAAIEPRTGEQLGVARYVRDPDRPDTAEASVSVVGEWRGRGVGGVLLRRLCRRARAEGVDTFTARLLTENPSMLPLFERLGRVRASEIGDGMLEIEVELPVDETRTVLRSAATGHVRS